MAEQVLSVAILEAFPGKEAELVSTLREFYTMMKDKGYSTDALYRNPEQPGRLFHVRRWKSARTVEEAQNDPDVHRYWQMLPELCTIPTVHENLETLFES